MGKSSPKQQVTEYRMSIHFGICAGPIDYISRIIIGEKEAWKGKIASFAAFTINKTKLFGGIKKEGGVSGQVTYMPGAGDQVMPDFLAGKYGKTAATMPAYRGISSLFFTEVASSNPASTTWFGIPIYGFLSFLFNLGSSGRKGFYWTANSPYLRGVWVEAARASIGLNPAYARIFRASATTDVGVQMNIGATSIIAGSAVMWDTWGNYAICFGDEIVTPPFSQIADVKVWSLIDGTRRTIPREGFHAGTGVHIDRDGEIVVMQGGSAFGGGERYLKFYNPDSLAVNQSIEVGLAYQTGIFNGGLLMDDLIVGEDRYMFGRVGELDKDWMLLHRTASTSWSVIWCEEGSGIAYGTISMGPKYAYSIKADGYGGATYSQIILTQWTPSFDQQIVTPSGIGSREIYVCHYFQETDEVVIVCTNGDILIYNTDLTVLKRSSTGNSDRLGIASTTQPPEKSLLSKRLSGAYGTIVLPEWTSGTSQVVLKLHHIDVRTLEFIKTTVVANTDLVNKANSFRGAGVNEALGGLFMIDGVKPTFWPFVPHDAFDSNPAHILFEILPYTKLGTSDAGTDKASFEAAAVTLFNERFGLSLIWTRQSTIEDFAKEIQDHIEAAIFLNPKTGLLTIKLIRGDYDPDTLPVFGPDNCTVTNFSRKLWGETINEIVVSWTNPENEEEETVTVQDLANIAVQDGHIISDSRDYYGIRRRDLAAFAAQRDLRVASAPLASCDLECNRDAWDLLPGDVIKLVSPEDGITSIIMRVGPVDYGKPGDSKVKVNLAEDIFALPLAEYDVPPPPADNDASEDPAPAAFTYIFTLPLYLVGNKIDPVASAGAEYPVVFAGVLAAQTGSDTFGFDLVGQTTDAVGNVITTDLGARSIISRATLQADIDEEVETAIASFPDRSVGESPAVGGLIIIGNGEETEVELALVVEADEDGYLIRRGVLDTVPREWAAGTPLWFVNSDLAFVDNAQRSDAETVQYKVLPQTSQGTLEESAAAWISETLMGRPWLPFRPAGVLVNGTAFGDVDATALSTIPVAWFERNRLTEDSLILSWTDATVTPEAGQTTLIYLTDSAGTVVHTYSGLTGTSFDVTSTDFGSLAVGYIVVKSERDGFESLQGHRRRVLLANSLLMSGDQQGGSDHIALSGDQGPGIILISGS